MKKFRIKCLSEYIGVLEKLGMNGYIYRGQNNSYEEIIANGFRPYNRNKTYEIDNIIKSYYNKVLSEISIDERKYFLAFCQHYGIPTNLVDFSYSPLVALFFACLGKKRFPIDIKDLLNDKLYKILKKDKDYYNSLEREYNNLPEECAHVYMIKKDNLVDITNIEEKINGTNFFLDFQKGEDILFEFTQKVYAFFKNKSENNIINYIISLMEQCKRMNIDLIYEKWEYEMAYIAEDIYRYKERSLYDFEEKLKNEPLKDVIHYFWYYIQRKVHVNNFCVSSNEELLAASEAYALLLKLLIDKYREMCNADNRLDVNLGFYLTYTPPPRLFKRIEMQKGLFIYQPYFYQKDGIYDRDNLILQSIKPDVDIEIFDCEYIFNELDDLGTDIGSIYGDLDNIAKSTVSSFLRN